MIDLQNAFPLDTATARDMQDWLQEHCVLKTQAVTPFSQLHADWLTWADQHDCYRSSPRRLAMALCYLGLQRSRIHSGTIRAYRGIALKSGGAA